MKSKRDWPRVVAALESTRIRAVFLDRDRFGASRHEPGQDQYWQGLTSKYWSHTKLTRGLRKLKLVKPQPFQPTRVEQMRLDVLTVDHIGI